MQINEKLLFKFRKNPNRSFYAMPSVVKEGQTLNPEFKVIAYLRNPKPLSFVTIVLCISYLFASRCTVLTALPDGSFRFLNEASHASASGVLHATEGTEGTHAAAASEGKCSVKIER